MIHSRFCQVTVPRYVTQCIVHQSEVLHTFRSINLYRFICYRPMTINKLTASLVINLVCNTYVLLHRVYRYTVMILCLNNSWCGVYHLHLRIIILPVLQKPPTPKVLLENFTLSWITVTDQSIEHSKAQPFSVKLYGRKATYFQSPTELPQGCKTFSLLKKYTTCAESDRMVWVLPGRLQGEPMAEQETCGTRQEDR